MVAAIALVVSGGAHAQDTAKQIQVGGLNGGAITLDGVLDEPAWQNAGVIEDLVQQSPKPGEPTPYHTRILLLHDGNMLYIGLQADDPDMSRVSTHTLVRDGDQGNDDNLTFVLDTFGTKRVAYIFQVNAAGAMADGLLSPTPAINSNNGVDYNWDGIWQAVVSRNEHGWTAEIAIDTRSLQFGHTVTNWGFNASRNVPRDLLTLNWSGTTLDSSVFNLQREGSLTGVQGLTQGAGLDFQPYGLAKYQTGQKNTSNAGFDLKYNFTPSVAGLLTYHTDFGEAQADQQQINTGRFALFFPEKRQFFLQGSNLLSFGYQLGTNFVPFYSRTIGLTGGEVVPLDEGAKVIGQGDSGSFAVLDTQMAGNNVVLQQKITLQPPVTPTIETFPEVRNQSANLLVGRGTYNLDQNLQLGVLATRGDPTGLGSNSFVGTDALWKTANFQGDKNLNLSAWGGRSTGTVEQPDTNGVLQPASAQGNGYGVGIEYPNDLWYFDATFNQFSDSLTPALGFLPRPGTRQDFTELTYQPRPASDSWFNWVHRFWFDSHYSETDGIDQTVNGKRGKQSSEWWYSTQMLTNSGWFWEWDIYRNFDAPQGTFDLVPNVDIPKGEYTWTRTRLVFNSPTSKSLWFQYVGSIGTYYAGTAYHPSIQVNWALPSGTMQLSATQEVFFYYQPGGTPADHGITRLSTLTGTYSFSPTVYLSLQSQYENAIPGVSLNARLRWIVGGASNIYLVWNHGAVTETNGLGKPVVSQGNEVLFKVQWDFRN